MADKISSKLDAAKLRSRAEKWFRENNGKLHPHETREESQRLLYELQIHQIELEMQNAELYYAREKMEAALQKYTDLYDFAPVGYLTLDHNGAISAVNLAGATLLGVERSKLIGRRFAQFVTAAERPEFTVFIGTVSTSRGKKTFEVALRNEGNIPLIVLIEAMSDASGQECHLALINISERRQFELTQRESEQKFRTLTENSPNIIIRFDRVCRRTYVNPAYTLETGISSDLVQNVIPDTQQWAGINMTVEEYLTVLRRVMETGVPAEILLELLQHGTGQVHSHILIVVAEKDTDGKTTGCLAISQNISRIKEAEFRMAKLAETSPGVMYILLVRPDGTSCMSYVSPRIKALYGLNPEDMVEDMSKAFALIHLDDIAHVQKSMSESTRTLNTWHAEFRIRHPAKGEIWLEGHATPKLQLNGSSLWYGFLYDITDRKHGEENLHRYARRLIEMEEELKKELAAELHDIVGRDLTAIGMNLAVVSGSMTDEAENIRARIQDSGRLIKDISSNVRDFMANLRPPVLDEFGLLPALCWYADLFLKRYSITVLIQADEPFPRLMVEKETALFRISQEALLNAAKYANTQSVMISLKKSDDSIRLAVIDEGTGFTPAVSSHVQEGFGWGMKIMRERAELIGGKFHVDSAPGIGTIVSVDLPLEDV